MVQKFIEKITPMYTPEAIRKFKEKLRKPKKPVPTARTKVKEKRRALKNHV